MPITWACLTACALNSAVYSCFSIFFTLRPSGLDANHRPLEDEKRRAAQSIREINLASLPVCGRVRELRIDS